jgi:hypothetical protein
MPPSLLFSDTTPAAEAVLLAGLRHMSGWRRLQMVGQLNARMRTLLMAGLRARHPAAGPAELHRRLADLLLGAALAEAALGPLAAAIAADCATTTPTGDNR